MDGCDKCNIDGEVECEMHSEEEGKIHRKVTMETYLLDPERYELRSGKVPGAPKCPYGNSYRWIGYDLELKEYIRFTKSVFKKLRQNL